MPLLLHKAGWQRSLFERHADRDRHVFGDLLLSAVLRVRNVRLRPACRVGLIVREPMCVACHRGPNARENEVVCKEAANIEQQARSNEHSSQSPSTLNTAGMGRSYSSPAVENKRRRQSYIQQFPPETFRRHGWQFVQIVGCNT